MKKRNIFSIAAAAALAFSLVGCTGGEAPAANTDTDGVGDKIVVYTTMDDAQTDVVEEAWYKMYPDCTIEWQNDSIGTLMTKVQSEASNPVADVVLGGLFQSDDDSYKSCFEKYTPSNEGDNAVVDPDGVVTYFDTQWMALIVNNEQEKNLGFEIKSYEDLTKPELKGKIIIANPAASSSGFRQYTTMLQVCSNGEYGDQAAWDVIDAIMANSVQVDSSSQVYKSVMDGEYVVGLTWESIVLQLVKNGADNVHIVYPTEGNTACSTGGAIVKDAQHRKAAEALMELLGDRDFQYARAEANCTRGTVKNFEFPGFPTPEEVGLQELDFNYLAEHRAELLEKWEQAWTEFGN